MFQAIKQYYYSEFHQFCIKHQRDHVSNAGGNVFCPDCQNEWHDEFDKKRAAMKKKLAGASDEGGK